MVIGVGDWRAGVEIRTERSGHLRYPSTYLQIRNQNNRKPIWNENGCRPQLRLRWLDPSLGCSEIKISLNHYILSRSNCKDLRRVGFCKGGRVELRVCANVYIGTQNANHTIDLQIKVLRILFGQICGSSTQKFAVENEPLKLSPGFADC